MSRRAGAFTIVEVVFAVAILAIAALMVSAAISSSERMTSIGRERAIANNVLRAFLERMRRSYPKSANDSSMIELTERGLVPGAYGSAQWDPTDGIFRVCVAGDLPMCPDSTPIYDLQRLYPTGSVERSVLKNVEANVFWLTDETGANWGPALTAALSNPTSVAAISTAAATFTSPFTGNTIVSKPSTADLTSLGIPRDMNANGTTSDTDCVGLNSNDNLVLVPMKVQLTWISGNGTLVTSGQRQSLTIYALLSPQH